MIRQPTDLWKDCLETLALLVTQQATTVRSSFAVIELLLTKSTGTGHPALTIPVGFVPATDDKEVKLPAGLQIVGKKFAEIECLKIGAAWEDAYDWKTI